MTSQEGTVSRTAVLFTGHFYDQKRRGSFHWLADELVKAGWRVRFVSVGYSWLSLLIKDRRLQALDRTPPTGWRELAPGLNAYFQFTPFHPVDLRRPWLNRIAAPLFRAFPLFWRSAVTRAVAGAELAVIESGLPLALSPVVRAASNARLVYRVNDDVRLLRMPATVVDAEQAYAPLFDRISVASPILARRFESFATVALDPMGLEKRLFSTPRPSPFEPRWPMEAVCAGTTQFDAEVLAAMAALRPAWRFHVIGRLASPVAASNVICHGELPFEAVVPFVQHADIGLALYRDLPGVEYQTHHSNRMLQYAFLKLPTLAPRRMASPDAPHVIGYEPGDLDSLERALDRAADFDRDAISVEPPGWDQLAQRIAGAVDGGDGSGTVPSGHFRPDREPKRP